MKKLLKSKLFISIAIAFIFIFLAFLFLYMILGNDLFGGTAEIISKILATQIQWYILGIIVALAILALLVVFVLPFSAYVLSKLFTYLSVWLVCLKEKHQLKLSRAPFASICGIKEQADLTIKTQDYKISVHFIDVPFGLKKQLTVVDKNNYIISSTYPGSVKRIGGGPPTYQTGGKTIAFVGRERDSSIVGEKQKSIPNFATNCENEYHYIVICPGYVNAKVIVGNGSEDINAETDVGSLTVCKVKTLKKRLKNQLYNPINKN